MATDLLQPNREKMNFLTRYLVEAIENFLPSKTKRLVVVSAALGCAFRTRTLDDDLLCEVNNKLQLSKTPEELKFGVWINQRVFDESKIQEIPSFSNDSGLQVEKFTDEDTWRLSSKLARSIPRYFCYGSLQLMTTDIHEAIHLLLRRLGKSRHPLIS